MNNSNTWCVYKHTSPSGKVYIGITHYADPRKRWGKNGVYYSKRTVFYKAIQKYGWDNFSHEILDTDCTEAEAKQLEVAYIAKYSREGLSYNTTIGGEGYNLGKDSKSAEYRTKQSRLFRQLHPDWDRLQYQKHCEKKKAAARQYYENNREKVLEYKKSEEVKAKARLRAAEWRKKHPNYMKEYMQEYNRNKPNE